MKKIKNLSKDLSKSLKQLSKKEELIDFKGSLIKPVKGRVVSTFGLKKDKKLNVSTFQNGIKIKADLGSPVRNVLDGMVIYSDWFKGYGNLIIIHHGKKFYTIYASLESIFKKKGDSVKKNEVIGTVGNTGQMGEAVLYFELREKGRAVNPLKWIKF